MKLASITSDPLMTKISEQDSNIRWLRDLLSRPLSKALGRDVAVFSDLYGSRRGFDRARFFDLSGIRVDEFETQFYFDDRRITGKSVAYLQEFFPAGSLIVGYELSRQIATLSAAA